MGPRNSAPEDRRSYNESVHFSRVLIELAISSRFRGSSCLAPALG